MATTLRTKKAPRTPMHTLKLSPHPSMHAPWHHRRSAGSPAVSVFKHPVPPTVLIPILITLLQPTCDLYPGHTDFGSHATCMHLSSVA